MQAWLVHNQELVLGKADTPQPQGRELLVRVQAFGLNRADLAQKEGRYPAPADASPILGLEMAGTVVQVPADSRFKVDDAVFGLVAGGAYAEYVVIDESMALPLPQNFSMAQAAALPEAWLTVLLNLKHLGQIQAGHRVLIHAGASGVGSTAIQYAKHCGAYVLATTRSAHKLAYLTAQGVDEAWLADDWCQQTDALKADGGVDFILDPVGASYFEANQKILNLDGKMVFIGIMGGHKTPLNLGALLMKRQQIIGSTLRSQPLSVKQRLNQDFTSLISAIEAGTLTTHIDQIYTWADTPKALEDLAQNRNSGKLIVTQP
ncbi:MAG: NAD(P)H-quinone oxidoreductase [Neisseriaceae bacterium]|nr:NAD(P)H-quinone oxidoreductase [Neisseriaceae bacterium]MBP6862110.1 NAD(P)H-quinone oxidoreductase [Neisseriaceae bacterium]